MALWQFHNLRWKPILMAKLFPLQKNHTVFNKLASTDVVYPNWRTIHWRIIIIIIIIILT